MGRCWVVIGDEMGGTAVEFWNVGKNRNVGRRGIPYTPLIM